MKSSKYIPIVLLVVLLGFIGHSIYRQGFSSNLLGAGVYQVVQGGTGASTLTGCLTGNGTGAITGSGAACAGGGGNTFDFTIVTNFGTTTSATSTPLWLKGSQFSLFASSTAVFENATTSLFTISSITSAIPLTDANGFFSEYTGTSCTNQFVRSLSVLAVATCATVGAGDVSLAALTATDTTLTFSGSYTGATARTVGLNLGNANIWTALQQFNGNASSTLFSSNYLKVGKTASTTIEIDGSVRIATTTAFNNSMLTVVGTTAFKGQAVSLMASSSAGSASPYTVNWDNGNTQRYTLTGNSVFIINATSSNPIDGGKYVLYLCQDTTGSRTLSFVTSVLDWPVISATGLQNATTASIMTGRKANVIGMIYDGVSNRYNILASTTINCQP